MHASLIFGPGFEQSWFPSKFNRALIPELQDLLGVHFTAKGKEYAVLPPILYPKGSANKRSDLFLNPALAKASTFSYQ